jgi:hypothetical protein
MTETLLYNLWTSSSFWMIRFKVKVVASVGRFYVNLNGQLWPLSDDKNVLSQFISM